MEETFSEGVSLDSLTARDVAYYNIGIIFTREMAVR